MQVAIDQARFYDEKDLHDFGHDLMKMWNDESAREIQNWADEAAPGQIHNIMAKWKSPAKRTNLSSAQELRRHLKWLAEGYGRDSKYALRYPRGTTTTVPSPEFLIPIFEHVLDMANSP